MTALLIEPLDRLGQAWIEVMAAVAIQAVALAALALAASCILRRCSPSLRHGLWLIISFKLLIMPLWSLPIAGSESIFLHRQARDEGGQVRGGDGPMLPAPPRNPESHNEIQSGPSASAPSRELSWSWPLSWQSTLMLIWLGVILLRIGRIGVERMRLGKCLRMAETLNDARWSETVGMLAEQIGLHQSPRVLVTSVAASPFVCGLAQPTLVLPRTLLETITTARWRPILLHELAHLKRGDLIWGWLPELSRLFLWFHPVSHWVARRAQLERELACDGLAMSLSDVDTASYAQTLVDLIGQAVPT